MDVQLDFYIMCTQKPIIIWKHLVGSQIRKYNPDHLRNYLEVGGSTGYPEGSTHGGGDRGGGAGGARAACSGAQAPSLSTDMIVGPSFSTLWLRYVDPNSKPRWAQHLFRYECPPMSNSINFCFKCRWYPFGTVLICFLGGVRLQVQGFLASAGNFSCVLWLCQFQNLMIWLPLADTKWTW